MMINDQQLSTALAQFQSIGIAHSALNEQSLDSVQNMEAAQAALAELVPLKVTAESYLVAKNALVLFEQALINKGKLLHDSLALIQATKTDQIRVLDEYTNHSGFYGG